MIINYYLNCLKIVSIVFHAFTWVELVEWFICFCTIPASDVLHTIVTEKQIGVELRDI